MFKRFSILLFIAIITMAANACFMELVYAQDDSGESEDNRGTLYITLTINQIVYDLYRDEMHVIPTQTSKMKYKQTSSEEDSYVDVIVNELILEIDGHTWYEWHEAIHQYSSGYVHRRTQERFYPENIEGLDPHVLNGAQLSITSILYEGDPEYQDETEVIESDIPESEDEVPEEYQELEGRITEIINDIMNESDGETNEDPDESDSQDDNEESDDSDSDDGFVE